MNRSAMTVFPVIPSLCSVSKSIGAAPFRLLFLTFFPNAIKLKRVRTVTMQTMNIVMPEPLTEYVRQQVARLGYENASDYISELVQADQLRKERLALEAEVLRGLECKETVPFNNETRDKMRAELYRRLERKQG